MDSLLSGLFGSQDDDDQTRQRAEDFITRYDQGAPYDNISDDEALSNYQAVAGRLSPQELEESAAAAYARLSPDERQAFAQFLQQRAGGDISQVGDDPRSLAQATSRLQAQQPDGLTGLLGGGMLNGVLGGNDRGSSQQASQGGGVGDMLNSPIARAVLGGIAAMAMGKMTGRR